jgi:isochorismate synthase
LGSAVDLIDHYRAPGGFLFMRDGAGIATRGSAASAVVAAGPAQPQRAARVADELLGSTVGRDPTALVVGAIGFDGSVPALLTVPSRAARVPSEGHAVEVGVDVEGASEAPWPVNGSGPPVPPGMRAEPSREEYLRAVAAAVVRIRSKELRKVVLARSLVLKAPSSRLLIDVLRRLAAHDHLCHVFAAAAPGASGDESGLVLGASPELLVQRRGRVVTSTPLAGTAPRSADAATDRAAADRLRASAKDAEEHRLVVEAVADTLAPLCSELSLDERPSLRGTATVWHLATSIRGVLRAPEPGALALAAALHPTPAVCGTPRDLALQTIGELESVNRGLYAGFVGWMDGDGDGEWVVSLRCLEVHDGLARLFSGAGIVEASDPAEELAETDLKFRTLLEATAGP